MESTAVKMVTDTLTQTHRQIFRSADRARNVSGTSKRADRPHSALETLRSMRSSREGAGLAAGGSAAGLAAGGPAAAGELAAGGRVAGFSPRNSPSESAWFSPSSSVSPGKACAQKAASSAVRGVAALDDEDLTTPPGLLLGVGSAPGKPSQTVEALPFGAKALAVLRKIVMPVDAADGGLAVAPASGPAVYNTVLARCLAPPLRILLFSAYLRQPFRLSGFLIVIEAV